MARYCFYCGRELTAGEKCDCRSGGNSDKKADASGFKEHAHATSSASEPSGRTYGGRAGYTKKEGRRPKSGGSSGSSYTRSQARNPGRPVFANVNWQKLKAPLLQIWQYIALPADSISAAASGTARQPVALVIIFKGLFGGLFFQNIIARTLLQSVIVIPGMDIKGFAASFIYFLMGFGITVASSLLITFIYFLLLRFLYRRPVSFRQLLNGLCPSFFYVAVFILIALTAMWTTVFNAAMLLLAGFSVSVMIQGMALRKMLEQGENRSFTLIVLVQILYVSILATILNLSLPMLRALLESSPPV